MREWVKSHWAEAKLYIRLFLTTGVLFGTTMGLFTAVSCLAVIMLGKLLFDGLDDHNAIVDLCNVMWVGLPAGLFSGTVFGGIVSALAGTRHIQAVRQMAGAQNGQDLGVHHVRNVGLQLEYDKAFDLCSDSLSLVDDCRLEAKDHLRGIIVARCRIGETRGSWGDAKIKFNVDRISAERVHVKVSVRPVLRTVVVDLGRSLGVIQTITSFLGDSGAAAVT